MSIQSFRCNYGNYAKKLFEGRNVATFNHVRSVAERKLQMLDSAATLNALRSPPGNRLEVLSGDRSGEHGIGMNDQFRICFVWTAAGPADVEIVDYH